MEVLWVIPSFLSSGMTIKVNKVLTHIKVKKLSELLKDAQEAD